MRTFKKLTATLVAVMLVLSMCVTSFSVAAAETSTETKTIKVGVISYVYDETKANESSYQVHYWNNGGLSGDVTCTALGTTEKKSVGSEYWSGSEQTFQMYEVAIPAEATGYKFHIGDRWFGGEGDTSKDTAVYVFSYSGDKALYATSEEPTTTTPATTSATTAATEATTVAPTTTAGEQTTIKVGVISYVYDDTKASESSYQIHYWNNGGFTGDSTCTALGTTEKKSVGSEYWSGAEQTFQMYQATIPAEATGYKFHIGDRYFGGDGDASKDTAVYVFNYSGDKALYATSEEPSTTEPASTEATTEPASTEATTAPASTEATTVPSGDTVKFTDNQNWGTVYAYFFSDTQIDIGGEWPGTQMTWYETNEYGNNNYTVDIPEGATKVCFTNGSDQTVDVTLDGTVGYYTDGSRKDGKLNVFGWASVDPTTAPATEATTVAPTTTPGEQKTIKVGVISFVYDETKDSESSYQIHYWNDGGLEGDSACTALGTTESKSVGSEYWSGAEQTFQMYQATIPAEATGYMFHIGDRYFGENGDATKTNAVYVFNYSGDKALYDTFVEPTTVAPTTAEPTTVAPTTAEPTTAEPTTVAPTTVAPTTVEPTTAPATTQPSEFSAYAVKGDITAAFKDSDKANVVTATVDLTAGTYKFIVQNTTTGVKYGRKSEYTDTATKALFGANWGYCTFTATGGTYTFTYNTKANALTITCDSSTASSFSSMKLKGHVSMAMKDDGTGVIKNTIDLPAGVYNFGIADGDNFYGRMTTYTDIMPKSIVGNRWGFCKLNVTKTSTFEFTYDTNTKYMTVLPKSANDSNYTVMGDGFAMVLKNTDTENVVEETVTLAEGTYTFKISDGTVSYGRKATYTDEISKAMFGKGWDSCTLNVTGGDYTFTFNTKTNTLNVAKVVA